MQSIRSAVIVSAALIVALWWAVMPAPYERSPERRVVAEKQQCPQRSLLQGQLCVCVEGSNWTGSACAPPASSLLEEDTRHVETVDLRRRH